MSQIWKSISLRKLCNYVLGTEVSFLIIELNETPNYFNKKTKAGSEVQMKSCQDNELKK